MTNNEDFPTPSQGGETVQPTLEEMHGIYDPTSSEPLREIPEDPVVYSWMRTAHVVRQAQEANPDDQTLRDSMDAVTAALERRRLEIKKQNVRKIV